MNGEVLAGAFDVLVVGALIALAVAILFLPGLFRSGVLFIVFGLIATVAWVRLEAYDVALAEAVIGAGVLGLLVIQAVRQLDASSSGESAGMGDVGDRGRKP